MFEIVNDGFLTLETNATEIQRDANDEMSKKYEKCLFLIYQYVDLNIFEKIIE